MGVCEGVCVWVCVHLKASSLPWVDLAGFVARGCHGYQVGEMRANDLILIAEEGARVAMVTCSCCTQERSLWQIMNMA